MLVTCIAILAVDFKTFPRRFAKTETFGLSLMDVGVATFILSSALTSRFARGLPFSAKFSLLDQRFAVLGLGVGRLVVLKLFHYQEHLSEYGVHWNFFVTLFCVWVLSDCVHWMIRRSLIPFFAFTILFIYQWTLSQWGITEYIFESDRNSFFSANKEGIMSLFGFLPMYLLTEHMSYVLFFSLHAVLNASQSSTTVDGSNQTSTTRNSGLHHVDSVTGLLSSETTTTSETAASGAVSQLKLLSGLGSNSMDELLLSTQPVLTPRHENILSEEAAVKTRRKGLLYIYGTIPWRILVPYPYRPVIRHLLTLSGTLWSVWCLSSALIQPTSRRLTNASFVLFSLALSTTTLTLILLADVVTGTSNRIATLEYINTHQLAVFLFANVMTGLINMSIQTIYASNILAFFVLSVYISAVVGLSWVMAARIPSVEK
jgi:hypothetical protein